MADAITAFSMLMASQAPTFMGKPMDMVNTLTKKNYTSTFLMSGRSERELFRGGPELKDRILLEANDQGEWYLPAGYETDYTNPQTGTEMSSKWRYYRFPLVWTEHEIMHDVPTGVGKRYATHQLKEVMFQKKQVVQTNACNAMEVAKWAVPTYADMEAATGSRPQSILSFITENTHDTSGIGVPLNASGADWGDQLQGIDVSTAGLNTNWDNERLGYGSATDESLSGGDLLYKLKRMRRRLQYQALPGKAQYGDMASKPNCIAASEWGNELFSRQLRGGQDTWGASELQDGTLLVGGIEMVYISELDTVAPYKASGSSLTTEDDANHAGPRFYFLSKDCLRPIFFKDRYFHAHKPTCDIRQPHAWVQNFEIWSQLWCRDRRKLGIVYPNATIA